jgi:anaerobic selenocysteine-containing dehydrogenase
MNLTRRDILKLIGGSAAGFFFTPLPYKLLDDSSIWTQNWSLTPPLPQGPISVKYSNCTLCAAGCAVKAKCVNGIPYQLNGIPHHPIDNGALCARGIAGHHLANHPLRITSPQQFLRKNLDSTMEQISFEAAVKGITAQIQKSNVAVAVFDQQPGRTTSEVYIEFLNRLANGIYVTHPSKEEATLSALQDMIDKKNVALGYDFENTQFIVSFGVPLLDNWGIPGRMAKLFVKKKENGLKLIQIESNQSRTALKSDAWLPIKPGTEYFTALAIASVLINENLILPSAFRQLSDFESLKHAALQFTPAQYSEITGVDFSLTRQTARELTQSKSAIVLSGPNPGGGPFDNETEKIIASLNILIGSVGKKGGIVIRDVKKENKGQAERKWNEIQDHSIDVLFVDSTDSGYALPWKLIERKLRPQHTIVSLSPFLTEIAAHADYIVPAPAPYESLQDVPAHGTSNINSFNIAAPLFPKKEYGIESRDLFRSIAQSVGMQLGIPTGEEAIKQKGRKLFSAKRGSVFSFSDETTKPVSDFASEDNLYKTLLDGATWFDEPNNVHQAFRFRLNISTPKNIPQTKNDIVLIPEGWKSAISSASVSPILSKLFQESELRENAGTITINPETAERFRLRSNDTALLETEEGKMNVHVKLNTSVQPGVVVASVGPALNGVKLSEVTHNDVLSLCTISEEGTWRITPAKVSKI